MRYVQMARAPGRVRIILSRVLGGGLAAAAVRLIVFFLGQRDFFYLGIVGVVWLLEMCIRDRLSSIDRVSLIISDKLKSPLRCVFDSNLLKISTKTAIGDAYDECPLSGDGGGLEIGFNNKYLMDALKAAPADQVRLELTTGVSPCVILPTAGEENFLYMVLPVRLKAGE